MLKEIVDIRTSHTVCSSRGLCVGGTRYTLTLDCGHTVERVIKNVSKVKRPAVGGRVKCMQCKAAAEGEEQ